MHLKSFTRYILILLHVVLCLNCKTMKSTVTPEINKLNSNEINRGWKLLFDGKTLNGWHTYGKQAVGKAWKVEEGLLHFDPLIKKNENTEGGDIITNEEYENFHLKLEWKISTKGNSGIIFLVHEYVSKFSNTWNTGPEMQVIDNNGHEDAKIIKHRAG